MMKSEHTKNGKFPLLFGAKCGICIREEKNLVFQIDIMMNLHLLKCNKKAYFGTYVRLALVEL